MNTDKMYYLDNFCCICMNKSDLKLLFEVDSDGVSHYNKLISSIIEMNFKEMNDLRSICGECCITLNTVYNFRQMCLRSKTNLITHISLLQTSDHNSDSNHQIKFPSESSKENIGFSASVKEEYESADDDGSTYKDSTVDQVNKIAHSDIKVEDVEHKTMIGDYSEYYTEFNKIEIEGHQLEEVKEELISDTEAPQDGSTSQADTGTSEEPKGDEETIIGTEHTEKNNEGYQCEICQKNFHRKINLMNHRQAHSKKLYAPTVKFVKSRRGKDKVIFEGYVYVKQKNLADGVISFECERRRNKFECKAKIKLRGEVLVAQLNSHSHGPDPAKRDVIDVVQQIKGLQKNLKKHHNKLSQHI